MKTFDEIRGSLPYRESPEYLDNLLERCRENALKQAPAQKRLRPWLYGVAAAVAAVLLTLGVTLLVPRKSPMERFLASLSDDEAATLVVYDFAEDLESE